MSPSENAGQPETSRIELDAATSSQPYVAREMADCSIWLDNFVATHRAVSSSAVFTIEPYKAE
jgi:hypothetical protein